MPLNRIIGREPIIVTDITQPDRDFEQKRVSLSGFALDTYQEFGPPPNTYWIIDSMNFDATCDANVGTRDFYIYARDKLNNAIRFRLLRLTAVETAWMIGTYGSSYAGRDASSGTGSLSVPFRLMQHPCKIGLLKTTFHGAGDTCNLHMMIREYQR